MPDFSQLNNKEEEATTATTPTKPGPGREDPHDDGGPGERRPRLPFHRWVDVLPCHNRAALQQQHHQEDDGSALKRVSLDATATWYGDDDDDEDEDDFMDEQPAENGTHHHNADHPTPVVDMEDTMMMLDWAVDDDADHIMDTGVLSGLMILEDEYPHNDDSHALMNEIFLGEVAASSSPLRVECCWDQLGAAAAKDDDDNDDDNDGGGVDGGTCPDRSRGVARNHSSSSASSTASAGSSTASADDDDAQLSLQELFEKRRAQLEASMERSRKSRKVLEKHIQQRASLASVLADIERSSRQIIVEVLSTSDSAASSSSATTIEGEGEAAGGEDAEKDEDEESSMVTVEV